MVYQQNNTDFKYINKCTLYSIFQCVELYPLCAYLSFFFFFYFGDFDSQFTFTNSCHLSVFVIYLLDHAQIIVIIVYKLDLSARKGATDLQIKHVLLLSYITCMVGTVIFRKHISLRVNSYCCAHF